MFRINGKKPSTYKKRQQRARRATATGHDPRRAPAPRSEQIRGSRDNAPGTAAADGGAVKVSDRTMSFLKDQAARAREDSRYYVTAPTLAKVYRRGAGAYSSSHYPGMSRDGWARARVTAFVELIIHGKPANPRYIQDDDLLPREHPRSTRE